MSIRRQLVNFGKTCTDFRVGRGAFAELDSLVKAVAGTPKRALIAVGELADDDQISLVERALIDSGCSVDRFMCPSGCASIDSAVRLFSALREHGITDDDLVVALGGVDVCSLVAFCSRCWCSGTSAIAVPLTLDAMCTSATSMRALDVGDAGEMVSVQPGWDMVVCDIDLALGRPIEQVGMGYALLLSASLSQSKRSWEQFGDKIGGILDGSEIALIDTLCSTQTSRAGAVRSANPSARNAVNYGMTTMRALRRCLGADVPDYLLYAEGLRFEARLAHDVCGLSVDLVFEQDDRLEDLGIEELPFKLDVDAFIGALKSARFERSNRFMMALPKQPGSIRLSTVDDEVLRRHATAFLESRAELIEE